MFGELRHNFPVQLDVRFFEIVYQFAVRDSAVSSGGVYLYLPQSSLISLFLPSVGEGVQTGVEQGGSGHSLFGFSPVAETLNLLKDVPRCRY